MAKEEDKPIEQLKDGAGRNEGSRWCGWDQLQLRRRCWEWAL